MLTELMALPQWKAAEPGDKGRGCSPSSDVRMQGTTLCVHNCLGRLGDGIEAVIAPVCLQVQGRIRGKLTHPLVSLIPSPVRVSVLKEMAKSVKCLPFKHENLSVTPSTHIEGRPGDTHL